MIEIWYSTIYSLTTAPVTKQGKTPLQAVAACRGDLSVVKCFVVEHNVNVNGESSGVVYVIVITWL